MGDKPFIGKWISCLYRIEQMYYEQAFARFGIGSGHYSCLLCLFREQGLTQEEISRRLHLDKTTVARALQKLERLGYIERRIAPHDRRAYGVYLTEQGLGLKTDIRRGLKQWAELITADFSPAEREQAYSLLYRMAEAAIQWKETEPIQTKSMR